MLRIVWHRVQPVYVLQVFSTYQAPVQSVRQVQATILQQRVASQYVGQISCGPMANVSAFQDILW